MQNSVFQRLLSGLLMLLIGMPPARAELEFPQALGPKSALVVRLHPLSPTQCGVDFHEVGVKDEISGRFRPQLAFVRDRYDESYPGIAPKIRYIYSYFYPPRGKDKPPQLIYDVGNTKSKIGKQIAFQATTLTAAMFGVIPAAAGLVARWTVGAYKRREDFYRTRALYTLKLLIEESDPAQVESSQAEINELNRVIALGSEINWKGLLISAPFEKLLSQYQENTIRLNRHQSLSNLYSILNAEGSFVTYPLGKDFVLVYYDTTKPNSRLVDPRYLDLEFSSEQLRAAHDGLVPLGVFALTHHNSPVLEADLVNEERANKLRWAHRLYWIARQAQFQFIEFPFSFGVNATDAGGTFVLRKAGKNILTDTIKSDAQLYALLDSGLVEIDPQIEEMIRKRMRLLTPENEVDYLVDNEVAMSKYLRHNGERICEEMNELREKEFLSDYMSGGERFGWRMSKLKKWIVTAETDDMGKERRELIQGRQPLITARNILSAFDESRQPLPSAEIIQSLSILGAARLSKDISLISKRISFTIDPAIERAAIVAAAIHRHGDFAHPILEKLERIDLSGSPNFRKLLVEEMISALGELNYEDADSSGFLFQRAMEELRRYEQVQDKTIAELAGKTYKKVYQAMIEWQNRVAANSY